MPTEARYRWSRPIVGLACALSGCMGGQTGGEDAFPVDPARPPSEGPGVVTDGGCPETKRAVALGDASQLGFSGADVLAHALGSHSAMLRWKSSAGVVTFGPESGTSTIDLTVTYADGQTRLVLPAPGAQESAAPAGPRPGGNCGSGRLEVDVIVTLLTGGGALAEQFSATLVATAPDHASFSRRLRIDELVGSFYVNAPKGYQSSVLDVEASFIGASFSGYLKGQATSDPGGSGRPNDSSSAMFVEFADWP